MNVLVWIVPYDLKLGLTITLVGILVVFTALIVLNLIFNQIPRILKIRIRKRVRKARVGKEDKDCCPDISGDTNAAIALALHLYLNELHDKESRVMTIEKVSRRYSPWSSKIYGLRNVNIR
jgi:hypothetical protein